MASFTVQCPTSSTSSVRFGSAANNANDQKQQRIVNLASGSPYSSRGVPSVRFQLSKRKHTAALKVKASLNEITSEKSSKSAPNETNGSVTKGIPDEASISAFMAQVTDLIKLVDAKDITELSLKQQDCELSIKKKEAFQTPPLNAPVMSMPPSFYTAHQSPPTPPALAPAPAPASSALALPPPPPPAAKKTSSSHPPLKCPMAGTFYRSPAPGEPAFVKVGDKVQKGQVVCIVEAMKLMNEIEADQSGTIVEILLDDGKPVSIDTPLFVIAP